uniref:NADH-ubiquinone oxidoreductase chain 4L n=1 Tax=Chirotenon longimanus TaxID=1205658 RepID=A0A0S2MRJ4_9CUCU|nr:NADH deshydrogenase subunit 4L [Chirotenon longimanus]
MLIYLVFFMVVSGLLVFSFNHKHFLVLLLSMEYLVISLYLLMNLEFMFYSNEFFFLMIYLTMSVCEGVLGLSILVSLIRSFGNDYILTLNVLW